MVRAGALYAQSYQFEPGQVNKNCKNEKESIVHNDNEHSNGAMAPKFPIRKDKFIMDNKLIRQFGEDILCYRIRTERQKKRIKRKAHDRHLRNLYREEEELNKQNRILVWQALDPPIQKGWKRFFVLREDVAESKYAVFFENILAKINTYDWHYRRDFKVKKRFRGRKKYVVKPQKIKELDGWQFHRLEFTEAEKLFFDIEYRQERWSQVPQRYYVFKEPWRFVLRVRPNIIDKVLVRNSIIDARLEEIRNYVTRNNYWYRQVKLVYGYKWNSWSGEKPERERERNPLRNKPIWKIVEEAKEGIYKE